MRKNSIHWLMWIALACLGLVVFLGKAYETSLHPNDSALHASVAMQVTSHGILPKLPIQMGGVGFSNFNDHPFTLFYINGWIMRALGPSAFSAKLLPGLLAVGCILLTGVLGALLYSELLGFISAFLLVTSPEYIKMGANFHLDHPMTFFILLSFVLWLKERPILAGLAVGAGVWIKTPVALLLLPTAFLVSLIQKDFKQKFRSLVLLGISSLACVLMLWVVIGAIGGWSTVQDYWVRQVWGTAIHGRGFGAAPDYFLFFKYIAKHDIPWVVFLILSLGQIAIKAFKERTLPTRTVIWPLTAVAVLALALSPMRFKYDYYFLPAFPFLSILSAYFFEPWIARVSAKAELSEQFMERLSKRFAGFVLILIVICVITPIHFAPEQFPALKVFNAIIQSHGSCEDQILYVPGDEAYGGWQEADIEGRFYTGRNTIQSDCSQINQDVLKPHAAWIMLSRANFDRCLSPETRALFPGKIEVFGEILLSKSPLEDKSGVVDLSVLDRELKAVTDCAPAPLNTDRYHQK